MQNQHYKNRYHPMLILMYHSRMLSPEQIDSIPRTTRNNWNSFSHENYFGYELAKDYIADFDYMKDILANKHLKQGMKFLCAMSYGYCEIVEKIEGNKKLLRENAENITFSIERFARYGKIKLRDACHLFGVSRDWFYRHRRKKACTKSIIGKCFRQYPNQLTQKEVATIESIVRDPKNYEKTKTTLYFDSMRKELIAFGRSTFFKYADMVGYKKPKKWQKEERPKGFKATRPFKWLHVDVTHVQTQNDGIQYVAFIKDNFSKALLGYKSTSEKPDSCFIRDLFEQTFIKYDLLNATDPINILSDGGSENKGSLLEWINQMQAPPVVKKLTAKTDEFPFSNSMSESTHSIFKTEFMKGKHSFDRTKHLEDLDRFMDYYNDERFPSEHFGLTVMEVLKGEKPDRTRFREQIKNGRTERIEKNRAYKDCPFVCF